MSCLSGVLQGGEREVESWGEGGDVAGGAMRPRKGEGQASQAAEPREEQQEKFFSKRARKDDDASWPS